MANENLGSTVLHEHRKIVTLRHLLALVNFIAILASTLITRYFVLIRGTSDGVLLIINVLCVINGLQILLCILDYITKVMMGKYSKKLTGFSYTVGVIWFLAVVAEFVAGSYVLGEARIDLGVIAGLQLLTALIAYIAWPNIDYSTVRKMTHKNVRDDLDKRAKKARGGAVKYVLVCIFMVVLQIGMLFAYKLPPKVYDLFSESRQLQYQLAEDGQSYEVIGVYRGTSSYLNVPAVYNNKPVTKINEGALSNTSFLENNKIEKIDIGTPVVDENGATTIVSNILTIESGAIVNDKITSLTLPVSIIKIEDGAISSSSLKTLVYEAKADFAYSYLVCSKLSTVTFSGVEAGKIVSLDGMSETVTLEVAKDTYNSYREKNKEYMSSIRPILPDDEFVVDFYTNSDYYIESIICKRGESVELGYHDLKNDKLIEKIAPSVDTIAYINNRHETGTVGAKDDSAFRGWYFDQFFTNECTFTENGKISLTGDTSIYAKWIDEYTGTLDWGTFHPDGEAETLYWTDEDLVLFPVIEGRPGFEDGISWSVNGQEVTSSQNISESVTVSGKWLFDAPVVDIHPYAQDNTDPKFNISPDNNAITFTYDEYQLLHLEALMQHDFEDHEKFVYSTKWTKVDDMNFGSENKTIDVQNVPESGVYKLRVTATSPYGDESYAESTVSVTIAKKALDIGTASLVNTTVEYNAQQQRLVYDGVFTHDRIATTYTYYDADGNVIPGADSVRDVGRYKVVAHFVKNNAQEAANYDVRELNAEFIITPYELEFVEWSASDLVYNTTEQSVVLRVNGIRANDSVDIIYEGNTATDAGNYVAKAIGVSNPNYSIKNMDAANNCSHSWTIAPKQVTVKEWKLDGSVTSSFRITYNGEKHVLEAVPEGVYSSDLNSVAFIYDETANTVSAIDANVYTAKIIGVDNDNYTLVSESTQEWMITKKNITVHFDTSSSYIYNGKQQTFNATLSGVVEKDLELFTREKLVYDGKSDGLTVGEFVIDDNNLVVGFSAKNAERYTAYISDINSAADISLNYTLTANSAEFNIAPKSLSFINDGDYTYNGKLQTLELKVDGIAEEDLASVAFDQFTVEGAVAGVKSGECFALTLNAKDAGTYPVVISAFNNSNYSISETTKDLEIKKQRLTVEWYINDKTNSDPARQLADATELPYNYSGYDVSVVVDGIVNNENVVITLTDAQNIRNAASYTTVAELLDASDANKNYVFDTASVNWKINPRVVNFKWEIDGVAVNSEDNVPTFTYNQNVMNVVPKYSLLGDDTIDIGYAEQYNDIAKTDASTSNYRVAIESLGNSNYVIGSGAYLEWKIDPQIITINWSDSNIHETVYNGDAHGLKFTVSGLMDIDDRYIAVYIINNGIETPSGTFEFDTTSAYTEYSVSGIDTIVNAGEYVVHFGSSLYKTTDDSADTNYVVNCTQEFIKINQAPLTLAGWQYTVNDSTNAYTDNTNLVYNGSNFTLSNNILTALCQRSDVTDDVSLAYKYAIQRNAGDYTTYVELSGRHASNYYIVSGDRIEWSIAPKIISVDWVVNDFVYDTYYQTQTATYSTEGITDTDKKVYAGDTINITYSNNRFRDAGNYEATILSIGNTNYSLDSSCQSYAWTIEPKPVDISWSTDSFIYNGAVQYPKASYNSSVYVAEYTMVESKDVGTYTIAPVNLNNTNYVLSNTSMAAHTYYITPKTVSFSWGFDSNKTNAQNYTYDGTTRVINAYVRNICSGDVINIEYDIDDRSIHNVGTYTVNIKSIDNTNYQITADSSETSKTVTVSKRQISVTWGYDGNTSGASGFTYDGNTRVIKAYISNLCTGDDVTLNYEDNEFALRNAGDYTFIVTGISGNDKDNYELSSTITKTVTVKQKELRFEWFFGTGKTNPAQNFTYNGNTYTIYAYPTSDTIVSTDKNYVIVEYNVSDRNIKDAKSYQFTVTGLSGTAATNYYISGSSSYNSKSITVSKQVVTITWSGSNSVVYDGKAHSLTATVRGTSMGSSVTLTPKYKDDVNSQTNAGSYTFEVVDLSNNSNYKLPTDGTQKASLTISPQPVTITWSGTTQLTYDGESHGLVATVKGANDGKHVNFTYSNNDQVNASTYTVTVNLTDSNYTTNGAAYSKQLVIEKQVLQLKWYNEGAELVNGTYEIVYDGLSHRLYAKAFNANGDEIAINMNTSSYRTDVGSTEYTVSSIQSVGYNRTNYQIPSAATNTLTVIPQPVSITWTGSGTFTYDGNYHYLEASVRGANNNNSVGFSYNNSTNYLRDVGSLTRYISLNNSNYTLEGATGSYIATVEVTPVEVTAVWEGEEEVIYDGSYHYVSVKLVDSDGNILYTNTYSAYNVGEHVFEAAYSENYNITEGESTFVMTISY